MNSVACCAGCMANGSGEIIVRQTVPQQAIRINYLTDQEAGTATREQVRLAQWIPLGWSAGLLVRLRYCRHPMTGILASVSLQDGAKQTMYTVEEGLTAVISHSLISSDI